MSYSCVVTLASHVSLPLFSSFPLPLAFTYFCPGSQYCTLIKSVSRRHLELQRHLSCMSEWFPLIFCMPEHYQEIAKVTWSWNEQSVASLQQIPGQLRNSELDYLLILQGLKKGESFFLVLMLQEIKKEGKKKIMWIDNTREVRIDNGIVAVTTWEPWAMELRFPCSLKSTNPSARLLNTDTYRSKPEIAA